MARQNARNRGSRRAKATGMARKGTRQLAQRAKRTMRTVQMRAAEVGTRTKSFIEENPKTAAAIAAGVGTAVGAAAAYAWKGKRRKLKH